MRGRLPDIEGCNQLLKQPIAGACSDQERRSCDGRSCHISRHHKV